MHRGKLSLIFLLSFLNWQSIEQVRQLHASAHDLISGFVGQNITDKLTILCMKHKSNRVGRANSSAHERLYGSQTDQGKRRNFLVQAWRLREQVFEKERRFRLRFFIVDEFGHVFSPNRAGSS